MYQQIARNKRKTIVLINLFVIIILALGWVFGAVSDIGYGAIIIAAIISLLMVMVSYFSGDKIALLSSGAREIQKNDNPYLWNMVENLSITAGTPMPKVYVIDDAAMNAFATGRDPKHASIAVTTGIMTALENEELEGVLAHELSHIKNYDIRVMMVVIVLVGVIALLADMFLRYSIFGKRGDDRGNGQLGIILFAIGIVLAILSPLIAELIKLAVSRKREFLADASGALLTRYPEGLAGALEKISHSRPMKRANTATAHLFITNPFGAGSRKFFAKLFSTHPPTQDRIKALRTMN